MNHRHVLAALAIVATYAAPAQALDVSLPLDGQWSPFAVDAERAPVAEPLGWIDDSGQALNFTFTIDAGSVGTLTIVDAAIAADTFLVTNFGSLLGSTSGVPVGTYEAPLDFGLDYDSALAEPLFSRGVFTLGEGAYSISGSLGQSITLAGEPLNATAGAVRLSVVPVPEPSTFAMMLAGLGAIGLLVRRRQRSF